jgi:hypothetical protein
MSLLVIELKLGKQLFGRCHRSSDGSATTSALRSDYFNGATVNPE